jgi:hypothetical protein
MEMRNQRWFAIAARSASGANRVMHGGDFDGERKVMEPTAQRRDSQRSLPTAQCELHRPSLVLT